MTDIYTKFKNVHNQMVALKNELTNAEDLGIELFGISEQLIFQAEKIKARLAERIDVREGERKMRIETNILQSKIKVSKEEKAKLLYQTVSIKYGATRIKKDIFARASAYLLMRKYGYTLASISSTFNKGDHSTIVNALKTAEDLIWTKDNDFLQIYNEIKDMFDKIYIECDDDDDELPNEYLDKIILQKKI